MIFATGADKIARQVLCFFRAFPIFAWQHGGIAGHLRVKSNRTAAGRVQKNQVILACNIALQQRLYLHRLLWVGLFFTSHNSADSPGTVQP